MARPSSKKSAPRASKPAAGVARQPRVSAEPPEALPDEPELGLEDEREPTPEEARARDQGTLRFFALLLAAAQSVTLGWALKTHVGRAGYLAVAGAFAVLFGTPMLLAWRSISLARASSEEP